MGIDVYLNWRGKTAEEKMTAFCGFDTTVGAIGYLREGYHGGPYATQVLIPEGWDESAYASEPEPDEGSALDMNAWEKQPPAFRGVPISAAVLKKRVPAAVMTT